MQAHPDQLMFIDKTSVKTNLTRQYGRSLCGKRLGMGAPFGAWETQTFVASLMHDNLIAPWVITSAMDRDAFEAYVQNVLALELQPLNFLQLRQPRHTLQQGGGGFAECGVLVPLPAVILPRPQSH